MAYRFGPRHVPCFSSISELLCVLKTCGTILGEGMVARYPLPPTHPEGPKVVIIMVGFQTFYFAQGSLWFFI